MKNEKDKILKAIEKDSAKLSQIKRMLKGTVSKVYVKCGNKNCSCTKEKKHEAYLLTYKGDKNITKTVYIRKDKFAETKKFIANYHKAKTLFNKILALNIALLKADK